MNFLSMSATDLIGIGVIVVFVISMGLLVLTIRNSGKIKKMNLKYAKFMKEALPGGNLENVIDSLIDNNDALAIKTKEMSQQISAIKKTMAFCGQKISIVRYNAFDDVGSDQSFSVAILDEFDNGITFTGIYARDSSSIYAKPIEAGKSRYALSKEEMQALEMAKKEYRERV